MLFRVVFATATFVVCAIGNVQARGWTLADIDRLQAVTSVEASSGSGVLYGAGAETTHYFLFRNGASRALPHALDGANEVHFSPAGDRIAFVKSTKNHTVQLWLYDPASGQINALTSSDRSIRRFAWSPDGKTIAAIETLEHARKDPPLSFWFDPDIDVLAARPPQRQVWLIDAANGAQQRLINDSYSYGGPVTDHDPQWSAGGREIALVRQPTPFYAAFERAQDVTVDATTGSVRSLANGPVFMMPFTAPPVYSGSGHVATVHTYTSSFASREDVFIDNRDASARLDRDFWSCGGSQMAWQGNSLLITGLDGVDMRLYRMALGHVPVALTPPGGSVEGFSPLRDGSIAIIYSTPEMPPELYLLRSGQLTRLTRVNTFPAGLAIATTKVAHWNSDGRTLVGQLTLPTQPAAFITEVHGGPQCADDSSFNPLVQYFATNGYAFFRPSPRGSDGYGDWSYKAIVNDWGPGPMADVLAGVETVARQLHVPQSKTFLYGASYGGYLTSWIVTHTARFHAAVAGVPVTDLTLDYALTQSPNVTRRFFGRKPVRDNLKRMDEQSPIRYAKNVRTPLLIISGLRDTQAPYPQGIEFYKMLQEMGKRVALLAYPNMAHGPDSPAQYDDWIAHIAGWFRTYGGPKLPGELMPR